MRILEARDSFIKVESNDNLPLSSFLQIDDIDNRYIAQVIQISKNEETYLAYAKILFNYDGSLCTYNKTVPSRKAKISTFDFEILKNSFPQENPISAGKYIDKNIDITVDKSCFDKNILMSIDSLDANKNITTGLIKQFLESGTNVLVLDMLGIFEGNKIVAGIDFKLPLNTDSLEFMFEDCLNDATSDSKNLIKDIFQDLSDYSKTVPFLPFSALKTIVDDMVNKSHIFKLIVLKNKLEKFDREGYFAANSAEAENLKNILKKKFAVIDFSKLDSTFQNRYIATIYSELAKLNLNTQVIIEASNNINKKSLKTILTNPLVKSAFITHSRFKFISEIKSMFENFIIEPSFTNNEVFKTYKTFLNAMGKNTYLLVGKGTNYIPLISNIENIDYSLNIENIASENSSEIEVEINEEAIPIENSNEDESEILDIISELNKEEKDSQTIAIEKKSEELISKVTEDINENKQALPEELFSDEDDSEEILEVDQIEIQEDREIDTDNNENNNEILEELLTEEEPSENMTEEPIVNEDLNFVENTEMETASNNMDSLEEISESAEEIISSENELIEAEIVNSEMIENSDIISNSEDIEIQEDEVEEYIINETIEIPEDISDLAIESDENEVTEEDNTFEEPIVAEELTDFENSNTEALENIKETTELENIEEFTEIETIEELDLADESNEEIDLVVELDDADEIEISEDIDKQIVEDVDKVFTSIKDDSLSDSDLDFIDELNNKEDSLEEILITEDSEEIPDFEENAEDDILEPLEEYVSQDDTIDDSKEILEKKSATTPMVPIYDAEIPAEDLVTSDDFEQGDIVTHAKYGNGVVEKMIKYGTKTLYSINFDNVGRRLLDPTLTEIKKN